MSCSEGILDRLRFWLDEFEYKIKDAVIGKSKRILYLAAIMCGYIYQISISAIYYSNIFDDIVMHFCYVVPYFVQQNILISEATRGVPKVLHTDY